MEECQSHHFDRPVSIGSNEKEEGKVIDYGDCFFTHPPWLLDEERLATRCSLYIGGSGARVIRGYFRHKELEITGVL